jgi:hypothetical protein
MRKSNEKWRNKMTFKIENEIPNLNDEDKNYLIKICDGLFDEYNETLDDKEVNSFVATEMGAWVDTSSRFMEWLHDKLDNLPNE